MNCYIPSGHLLRPAKATGVDKLRPLHKELGSGAEQRDREEYVRTNYLGEVHPDDEIPVNVEASFPEQFRWLTLRYTPPVSDNVQ